MKLYNRKKAHMAGLGMICVICLLCGSVMPSVTLKSVQAKTNYKMYRNGRFNYKVKYPSIYKEYKRPDNGDGCWFRTKKHKGKLTIWGGNNILEHDGKSGYKFKKENTKQKEISHKAGKNYYGISFKKGSMIEYEYVFYVKMLKIGFNIQYPVSHKNYYKKVIKTMENSVKNNTNPNPI